MFLSIVLGLLHLATPQDSLQATTASLWNSDYISLQNPSALPNLTNAEDVHSEYGGFNFILISRKQPDIKETTLSLDHLEIGIDLTNTTSHDYLITAISLTNLRSYPLSSVTHEKGNWEIPQSNGYLGNITLKLNSASAAHHFHPKDLWLHAANNVQDRRLNLTIEGTEALSDVIICFDVTIEMVHPETNATISIQTEKSYFIAFQ